MYTYYCVLCVTNLAPMGTMYMINFVNKLQKVKKKDNSSPISIILITDRQIGYVFVGLQPTSSNCHFTKYLTNLVVMATIYMVNWMGKMMKNVIPSSISTILITESKIFRMVCMCRSTSPLYKNAIVSNIQLICLPWQPFFKMLALCNINIQIPH